MIVFDAPFMIYFLDPKIQNGVGNSLRVDHLVATIQKSGERIVVPTPVLSELLVKAGDAGPKYLEIIARSKFFRIAEFDARAAVEAAALTCDALAKGDKRGATPEATRAEVKFDRQIVAIARVVGAMTIYTDDVQLATHANAAGIDVIDLASLPEPPTSPQLSLELEPPEPELEKEDDPLED